MLILRSLAASVGIATCLAADAQDRAPPADPANPAIAGPAMTYRSAMADYRPAPETSTSPDRRWIAANEAVAGMNDMGDMQDGKGMEAMPAAGQDKAPAAAAPAMDAMPMDHHHHSITHRDSPVPTPPKHGGMAMPDDGMEGSMMHGGHTMPKGQ